VASTPGSSNKLTPPRLAARTDPARCVDWPGARKAQRVVDFASPLSESPGETLGRIAFDVLGIPQPDQQVYIFDQNGFIGRSDYSRCAASNGPSLGPAQSRFDARR
jgi:hypothetical protein